MATGDKLVSLDDLKVTKEHIEDEFSDLKSAIKYQIDELLMNPLINAVLSGSIGQTISFVSNNARVCNRYAIPAFKGLTFTVNNDYDFTWTYVDGSNVVIDYNRHGWIKTVTLNYATNYLYFTIKKSNGANVTPTEARSAITINFEIDKLLTDKSLLIEGKAADAFYTKKYIDDTKTDILSKVVQKDFKYKLSNNSITSEGTGTTINIVESDYRVLTEKIPVKSGMKVVMNDGYEVSAYLVDASGKQLYTYNYASSIETSPVNGDYMYFIFRRYNSADRIDPGEIAYCGINEENVGISKEIDIIFWGDSLTMGAGGNGVAYPQICGQLLHKSTFNCGVGGETANTIACRQGSDAVMIPAGAVNGTYANGTLLDEYGHEISPIRQGRIFDGWKKILINNEVCTLSISQTSPSSDDAVYTISGYTGEITKFPMRGRFLGGDYKGDITCILSGQNGAYVGNVSDVNARITIIDAMIESLGNNKYVVIGLPTGKLSTRQEDETAMLNHYGSKYLPTLETLINYGLEICGLTPTAQDETDIAAGYIPTSLRTDGTHLNSNGYTALAIIVADKINALGY